MFVCCNQPNISLFLCCLNEISQAAALQDAFKATPSPHSASELFQHITVLKALQVRHTLLQKFSEFTNTKKLIVAVCSNQCDKATLALGQVFSFYFCWA